MAACHFCPTTDGVRDRATDLGVHPMCGPCYRRWLAPRGSP